MAQVGTLTVDLIAQTAAFNSNIEKAAANLNSQGARMNRALSSVQKNMALMRAEAEGLALGLAIKGAASFVKTQLDLAGGLGEVAQQAGVTTQQLQAYRAIGTQVGVTQEEIDKGLGKLTISLGYAAAGAREQQAAFDALGISLRDSSGHVKTAGQALPEIADALARISDPAQRAAVEVTLFGRAGQKLDTILTGGSKGIEEYTQLAQDMGMILSDDVIAKADSAADKIAELNAQLTTNIQNAVAQNADAILGLATALEKLITRSVQFIGKYPELSGALAGAAAGSRFGLPGAAVGAAAGFMTGDAAARAYADGNMDVEFRKEKLRKAQASLERSKKNAGGPAFYADAAREVKRQQALYGDAVNQSVNKSLGFGQKPLATVDLGEFKNLSGGSHAKAAKDNSARNAADFASQLDRLNMDLLRARRQSVTNSDALLTLDLQQIAAEAAQVDAAIEAKVKAGDFTRAQGDQLEAINRQVAAVQAAAASAEAEDRALRDRLNITLAANDNEKDILQVQEAMARTAPERRALQLRMLELEKQAERLKLQEVVASATATDAEKKIAQRRLDALGEIYAGRSAAIERNTQGPLAGYLDQLPRSAAEVNEAFQSVAAEGLQSLNDGIVDAIMHAKSLGDVFKGVANQIIADLLRIAVQKSIVGPLANLLFGLGGGGSGPDPSMGDILTTVSGARARGGPVSGGSTYLVGENGPELFKASSSGSIVPNHRLASMNLPGGGGGNVYHISGNLLTPEFWAQIQAMDARSAVAGSSLAQGEMAWRQSRRVG